jgi:hypothetical protein
LFKHKEAPAQLVRFTFCLLALILVFFSRSQAQDEQPVDRSPKLLKVPVDLVVVPVTVNDSEGNLVAGLEKSDFLLEDDGVPQPISYFSIDPLPLSVAIWLIEPWTTELRNSFKSICGQF